MTYDSSKTVEELITPNCSLSVVIEYFIKDKWYYCTVWTNNHLLEIPKDFDIVATHIIVINHAKAMYCNVFLYSNLNDNINEYNTIGKVSKYVDEGPTYIMAHTYADDLRVLNKICEYNELKCSIHKYGHDKSLTAYVHNFCENIQIYYIPRPTYYFVMDDKKYMEIKNHNIDFHERVKVLLKEEYYDMMIKLAK